MKYASVCSGIEAASVAWEPLGWRPAWFSEIEPFPCAVLAHRFPNVPNMGDMTKIKGDEHGAIDLLVGGTPCQDLSVAGKRLGFGGKRSVLALDFVRLAYESGAKWIVWENVPGVFSSAKGQDFAQFLSLLAGWEVDVPKEGWGKFGIVEQSPGCFGLAWRVLDVQYARVDGFPRAIPQRRNRVFVVGYIGDWRRAAQVLFEPEGLLGNTPPRREAGKGTTSNSSGCVGALCARDHKGVGSQYVGEDKLVILSSGQANAEVASKGHCPSLTSIHEAPIVCAPVAPTLDCSYANNQGLDNQHINSGGGLFVVSRADVTASTIKQRDYKDATDLVCFDMKQPHNPQKTETVNLTTGNCSTIRGDSPLVMAINDVIHGDKACNGKGWNDDGVGYTVDTMATQGVVYPINTLSAAHCHAVATASSVRRLTPTECERLMGFPDNWTRIPWKGKTASECPDGPRYKACGNSMGVNVMRWIGTRIQEVEDNHKKENHD